MDTPNPFVPGLAAVRRTLAVLRALAFAGIADATPLAFQSLLAGRNSAITETGILVVRNESTASEARHALAGTEQAAADASAQRSVQNQRCGNRVVGARALV